MKTETKISLVAVIVLLCSLVCVWFISFNNQMKEPVDVVVIVIVVAVAVVAVGVAYDKEYKVIALVPAFLLLIVFVLPLTGIFPLSKYHNLKQLERDKKIVNMLKITSGESNVEILLPSEYAEENSYLEKVLSVGVGPPSTSVLSRQRQWKDIAIRCSEGKKVWYKAVYKATLLAGDSRPVKEINLFFNHAWQDWEITKQIE